MAKEIKYGSEARAALGAGVDKPSDQRDVTLFLTSLSGLRLSQTMV